MKFIFVIIKDIETHATVDEGSEINCLDEGFASKNGIKFERTDCKATAAGSTVMKLSGQTYNDITVTIRHKGKPIVWKLGRLVVVKNLGVDLLVGEPAKIDNEIVTFPHKRLIEMWNSAGKRVKLPYFSQIKYPSTSIFQCKAPSNETIYPSSKLKIKLPVDFWGAGSVIMTPKNPKTHTWIKPHEAAVDGHGCVVLENDTNLPVKLSRLEHFADVTPCVEVKVIREEGKVKLENSDEEEKIMKIYDPGEDFSNFISKEQNIGEAVNHLNDIQIDPDNILPDGWKERFAAICENFSHVINPRPGKYNGYYGYVDNSINFSTPPPPSIRARLPKYSHEMLDILGKKMDKLEEWGVLAKPEDIGVVPEFVLPSMLTPKNEGNEWRLVTDFTALNIHIKKLETVAPTIKEAKEKLAKYKYHIQLDLSNYYYQGGMKIEDCQYLATPHPFKGLRVYTCEPQGLRNAGEHAYERLGRV